MTVAELRDYLKMRGITTSGHLKPALLEIALAVEKMMMSVDPNHEYGNEVGKNNQKYIIHDMVIGSHCRTLLLMTSQTRQLLACMIFSTTLFTVSLRGRLFFFWRGGRGKSLQTYQQYFIFRGREMPRNAIGRNCDICQILHKSHYVIFSRK